MGSTMKLTEGIKNKSRWAALVRAERKRLKLSQEEFGAKFGVTGSAVSEWERELSSPSDDVTWYLYRRQAQLYKKRLARVANDRR